MKILLAINTLTAAACWYLASPHQLYLAKPWPKPWAYGAGSMLTASSLALWIQHLSLIAGLFATFTLLMCGFIALPLAGSRLKRRREASHE